MTASGAMGIAVGGTPKACVNQTTANMGTPWAQILRKKTFFVHCFLFNTNDLRYNSCGGGRRW